MDKYFINTGTVTKASMARDTLRRNGINTYVLSARGNLSAAGCGFGIVVAGVALEKAKALLQTAKIGIMGITRAN